MNFVRGFLTAMVIMAALYLTLLLALIVATS